MQNIKEFKRGDILFKEGDNLTQVLFIQSGKVSIFVERNGKKMEIEQLVGSQVLGENSLLGSGRQAYSAEAMGPTKILEIPTEHLKGLVEKSSPVIKLLTKSTIEGVKQSRQKIRSTKMESDPSPLPQMHIPKLFALFPILAQHIGKPTEEGGYVVSWQSLKTYAIRMFLEPPQRIQSGLELLKKLGYVELKTVLNEETNEEELSEVTFLEIKTIEDFAEFYQYHLYKPGRAEVIYVDEMAFKIIKVLVAMSIHLEVDFKESVTLKYDDVLKEVKNKAGLDLKNTHWDLLEKKGLFVQRKSQESGLELKLNKEEFIKTAVFWAFIKEINSWNEKGFIDFTEEKTEVGASGAQCPECDSVITEEQKFCSNCGFKLAA